MVGEVRRRLRDEQAEDPCRLAEHAPPLLFSLAGFLLAPLRPLGALLGILCPPHCSGLLLDGVVALGLPGLREFPCCGRGIPSVVRPALRKLLSIECTLHDRRLVLRRRLRALGPPACSARDV